MDEVTFPTDQVETKNEVKSNPTPLEEIEVKTPNTVDESKSSMQNKHFCVLNLDKILHDDPFWLYTLRTRGQCDKRLIYEKNCFEGESLVHNQLVDKESLTCTKLITSHSDFYSIQPSKDNYWEMLVPEEHLKLDFPFCPSKQVVSIFYFDVLDDPTADLNCFYLLIPNHIQPSIKDEHEHFNFRERAYLDSAMKSSDTWSYLDLPMEEIAAAGNLNHRSQDHYFTVFDHFNSVLQFKKTFNFSEFVLYQYPDPSLEDFVPGTDHSFPYVDNPLIDFIFGDSNPGCQSKDPYLFRLMNQPLKGGGDVMVLGSGLLKNKPVKDGRNPTKKVRIKPGI